MLVKQKLLNVGGSHFFSLIFHSFNLEANHSLKFNFCPKFLRKISEFLMISIQSNLNCLPEMSLRY
jgi:hypothetical protein